jgi:hypothetical protein
MGFNPEIHHRRSIRLQGYDYSTAGAYFVTVCVRDGECLFGEVADGEMRLNDAGRMVLATWNELRTHYPRVHVDVHIVMPNHFHGIVFLVGAAPRGRPDFFRPPVAALIFRPPVAAQVVNIHWETNSHR